MNEELKLKIRKLAEKTGMDYEELLDEVESITGTPAMSLDELDDDEGHQVLESLE